MDLASWLRRHGLSPPSAVEALSGGCVSQVLRLCWDDGRRAVWKTGAMAHADAFPAEASGLQALALGTGPRVPTVLAVDGDGLLLEYLAPGRRRSDYWPELGHALAGLHAQPQPSFGFTCDTFCGGTRQNNTPMADGLAWFAEHRLRAIARCCRAAGRLDESGLLLVDSVACRLELLLPVQAAALIHGDLWSGNVIVGPGGEACLIDPAVAWSLPEADLAMTTLFGGFPEEFAAAYLESRSACRGWETRADIYNLYHLLNHQLLFGGSYAEQALRICRRYT